MSFLRTIILLIAAAAIAPAARAQFTNPLIPSWQGQQGTEFSGWDAFSSAFGGQNTPDDPASSSSGAFLVQTTPGAVLNGNQDIFGSGSTLGILIGDTAPGDLLDVVFQARVTGQSIDPSSVVLRIMTTGGLAFDLPPESTLPLDVAGYETAWLWDASIVPDQITEFCVLFDTLGAGSTLEGVRVDTRFGVPSPVRLNEIYASHSGTDNQEYIELVGVPGTSLSSMAVLIVEGDSSSAGVVDRVFSLTGFTMPADGFFVLGDTLVPGIDLDIGSSNSIENGTATYYLLDATNPAALPGLLGVDVDPDGDGVTSIPSLGTILDHVALVDGGVVTGQDVTYDNANQVGPDAGVFLPAGIYRAGNAETLWCDGFLNFDPTANQPHPRTPGATNPSCSFFDIGKGCFGSGGFTPILQMSGDSSPGGSVSLSVYSAVGGGGGIIIANPMCTYIVIDREDDCILYPNFPLSLSLAIPFPGVGPGQGKLEIPVSLPPSISTGQVALQVIGIDPGVARGYSVSNGILLLVLP